MRIGRNRKKNRTLKLVHEQQLAAIPDRAYVDSVAAAHDPEVLLSFDRAASDGLMHHLMLESRDNLTVGVSRDCKNAVV